MLQRNYFLLLFAVGSLGVIGGGALVFFAAPIAAQTFLLPALGTLGKKI